jgi:hypothetical protein
MVKDIKHARSFREVLFYIFGDPVDVAYFKQKAAVQERRGKSLNIIDLGEEKSNAA